jgi:hypothetical protein
MVMNLKQQKHLYLLLDASVKMHFMLLQWGKTPTDGHSSIPGAIGDDIPCEYCGIINQAEYSLSVLAADVDALRKQLRGELEYAERLDMLWEEKYDGLKRTLATLATPTPPNVEYLAQAYNNVAVLRYDGKGIPMPLWKAIAREYVAIAATYAEE